jgi:hypothetical protein
MADTRKRFTLDPVTLRGESTKIILASDTAGEIKNFERTTENTLRAVQGPTKLLHYKGTTEGTAEDTGLGERLFLGFFTQKKLGVFHAVLGSGREILLLHTSAGIHELRMGRRQTDASVLKNLIGDSSKIPGTAWTLAVSENFDIPVPLSTGTSPSFPTQFEVTDKGIVIVPQQFQRAYFYDGDVVLPLGFDSIPSPPIGMGPAKDAEGDANGAGYLYDNANRGKTVITALGGGRLGTVENVTDEDGARLRLLPGSYRAATQWVDYFGNLSPISGRSGEVRFGSQKASEDDRSGDDLLKAVIWNNVDFGPKGTVGRRLYRTKDLVSSGEGRLFFLSGNSGFSGISASQTIPDNMSTHFADNTPDGWLSVPAQTDIAPVPPFKLCRFALGRLWIANTSTDPGMILPSLPGRYGTFLGSKAITPDPSSGEITGLWNTDGGLLAFTSGSSFLISPNDAGNGFRAATLSSTVGCVAPSSIASLPDGSIIWLGQEGFYRYAEGKIELSSGPVASILNRITKSRALQAVGIFVPESQEYRCWIPVDGNTENNLCLIYDIDGWRRRTNEHVSCACVTKDHRKYAICGGTVYSGTGFTDTLASAGGDYDKKYNGYFILDRANAYDWKDEDAEETQIEREYVIETSWIEWGRSKERKSAKTLYLSLVESSQDSIDIQVYRDWRKGKAVYSSSVELHSPEDIPPFWGVDKMGVSGDPEDSTKEWTKNRPLWRRVDVSVPSCEVYKIRLTSKYPFEFIGLSIDEEPKVGPTSRIP